MYITVNKTTCLTQSTPTLSNQTCADVCFAPTDLEPTVLISLRRMHHIQAIALTMSNSSVIDAFALTLSIANTTWATFNATATDIKVVYVCLMYFTQMNLQHTGKLPSLAFGHHSSFVRYKELEEWNSLSGMVI